MSCMLTSLLYLTGALATTASAIIYEGGTLEAGDAEPISAIGSQPSSYLNNSTAGTTALRTGGGGGSPARPPPARFSCGTEEPSAELLATIKHFNERAQRGKGGSPAVRARQAATDYSQRSLVINTYFHLVLGSSGGASFEPTQRQVERQLARLQGSFNRQRISFNLRAVTITRNDAWAAGADEAGMKRALRRGSYATLNIYFPNRLGGDTLGRCNLPGSVTSSGASSPAFALDGCVVSATTMPGGPAYGFNEGQTAVHEAGHWLGLLHTFHGYSCSGPGDFIADTPQQSVATNGCPAGKDSCPGQPGQDLINNFMDYSWDEW